ncbi:MAG: hypothetical protein LUC85_02665 [Bacteroidales bacterium]|nr:hypothetical protein [Bacteroidales bacterium]
MCATGVTSKASAPTFTPDGGDVEYKTEGTNVTIASGDEASSIIYYTIGGTEQSDLSPVSLLINEDSTISAYAVLCDNDGNEIKGSTSSTVTKDFTIQACKLSVSPAEGEVAENSTVTITAIPEDATITWIFDDGGTGKEGEGVSPQTLTLTDSGTLTVEVTKTGYKPAEGEYTYTVTKSCAAPTFDVTVDTETGYATVAVGATVTISTPTTGATIQYRLSEDAEWITGNQVVVTDDCTIYVQITKDGYTTATGQIVVKVQQLPAPELSQDSGKFTEAFNLTIAAAEGTPADATLWYKIDEGGWTQYTDAIAISTSCTVAAKATHADWKDSSEATATYEFFEAKKFVRASEIKEGVDYLVVGYVKSYSSYYLMIDGFYSASQSGGTFTIEDNGNTLQNGNESAKIIRFVAKDASQNQYYVMDGENYVYGTARNISSNSTVNYNTVTFDSDGYAILQYGDTEANHLQYNSTNNPPLFKYYSSNQSPIFLYMDEAFVTDVMDPVFSKSNCIVAKGTTITVTCATDGAEIDWTFTDADGNDISSQVSVSFVEDTGWTFDVTQNMTVTAQASKIGMDTSNVVTAEFTICDTDATPRFFKRIASLDDINAGIDAGKKFIIGAYSRFYMSDEGAARPALMSTAERTQTTTAFNLWAAPKQSTTLGVTNFALVGEEDGVVDDGDDEIELFNDGIMAMRTKDNTDDDFAKVAFVDIEYYTGTDRKDYKNVEIPETTQLYSFKIDGRYLCATTGSGTSDKNTLYWQDTQEPMILSMITSTEQVKETDEYLIGRVLCEWIKTVDEAQGDNVVHTYKCLEYNYSGDLNAYASYQQSVASKTQVYPFIYVEEDKTEIVTEIPDIETKYRGATSEAVRKSEGNVGTIQYDNDEPKNSVVPTVTFDLPSRSVTTVTGKRPKATVTDFDPDKDVVIVAIVKQHGKYEGKTSIFKSAVGQALSVPIYVDSDVYAYSMLDGYSSTKSGNSATYYLSVDDPTGIVEVGVDEIGVDAKVFNLQGQLLPRPVKGQVVIVAPSYGRAYKALLK